MYICYMLILIQGRGRVEFLSGGSMGWMIHLQLFPVIRRIQSIVTIALLNGSQLRAFIGF